MSKLFYFTIPLLLSSCASTLVMDRDLHDFHGKVFSGMMAIGGETTGIVLEATDGKTYELYMKNTGQLKKYHDKKVHIKGRYTVTSGTEILKREIIEVAEIQEE